MDEAIAFVVTYVFGFALLMAWDLTLARFPRVERALYGRKHAEEMQRVDDRIRKSVPAGQAERVRFQAHLVVNAILAIPFAVALMVIASCTT